MWVAITVKQRLIEEEIRFACFARSDYHLGVVALRLKTLNDLPSKSIVNLENKVVNLSDQSISYLVCERIDRSITWEY